MLAPASFLPLKPPVFAVLLSLLSEERHGYALLAEIEERTEGAVRLLPAALYRHLARMLDEGLIEESTRRPAPEEDERRRYYRITPLGRRVAEAEAKRLERVVAGAKLALRTRGAR